ncbi:MAG: S9 family peptidase [Gemmatimonadales bacterium]|nr:S9 family peptidase [Gemmatimonadales bacterium]
MHRSYALLLVLAAPAAAQSPAAAVLAGDRYMDYETVLEPIVSPDGAQVIFTRRSVDKMKDSFETALWIMNADGTRLRYLVKGSNAAWSPDGTRIAYLADGDPAGSQIYVRYMDAEGAVSQITKIARPPASLRWSPDGKWIGFVMLVPEEPAGWRIDLPTAPAGAQWTKAPKVVENLHYRADRTGYLDSGFIHLFVVPATGGTPRQVTRGRWNVGARQNGLPTQTVGWSWLPDGKSIVIDGNEAANAELSHRRSNLYAVDVATGAARRLTQPDGFWSGPIVSPDGKLIAFTGYPAGSFTYRTAELYTIAPDGSGMTLRSPGLDRDAESLSWGGENKGVYFTADDRGTSNLWYAQFGQPARQLTTGTHLLTTPSVAKNGTIFAVRANPSLPPDIVRVDARKPAAMTQLTEVNADLLYGIGLGEVEEIWYPSTGGAKVQGWIVKPPSFDPAKKYPLIMEIHGGPHSTYTVAFNYSYQDFAANGFVVLYTNPRGSTGYGSAFGNAIFRAYPSVDYDDLMAGVDTVLGRGYIDAERMYVGGCSGGGVLSSWVIGHTDRFAAAAVRCPVTDWMSFLGHTDIPLFANNFFEKPFWEDPAPWLKQSSLMYVGNVKTPTMLMTGVLDQRTPMAQTEEYYAALKLRGVPSVLLRFEGEWHGTTSKPSNWIRTQLYMMSWYRRWGGETARAAGARP